MTQNSQNCKIMKKIILFEFFLGIICLGQKSRAHSVIRGVFQNGKCTTIVTYSRNNSINLKSGLK